MRFTLFTKTCCPLCDEALHVLDDVRKEHAFELDVVDIETSPELMERYRYLVPVLTLDGEELFYGKISAHRLKQILQSGPKEEPGTKSSYLSPRYRAFLDQLRRTLLKKGLSRDKRP